MQELSAFTVQLCKPNIHEIVGAGFVIAPDGLIASCLHVVNEAKQADSEQIEWVEIYFPQTRHRLKARVLSERQMPGDDLAIVRLDEALPAGIAIALLGSSSDCQDHPFRSYGFRSLSPYEGGPASGVILGKVTRDADSVQYYDPLQIRSPEISPGMSGSAVLDLVTNRVVGIITSMWLSQTPRDRDTSFAAPAEALVQLVPNVSLHAPEIPPPNRFRLVWVAVTVLALLILTAVIWQLPRTVLCGGQLPDVFSYVHRAQSYRDEGNYACARRNFETGLSLAVNEEERAELYYGLVTVALAEEQYELAHSLSLEGLKHDSQGKPILYLGDGLALCLLDRFSEAAGQLDIYLQHGGSPGVSIETVQQLYKDLSARQQPTPVCWELSYKLP